MIKVVSSSVGNGVTECKTEAYGSGDELIKEYAAIVKLIYGAICKHAPKNIAKDILMDITNKAIKKSEGVDDVF